MEGLKPPRRIALPLSLAIFSCAVLLALTPALRPLHHLQALLLPPCAHVVLVSAARHGSSWFLNSAERCPAARSFERLNRASELWNRALAGPVRDLPPPQAADYADRNHSIKVFPLAFFRNATALAQFLQEVKYRKIPIFVLTRRLDDSYRSFREALHKRVWNVNEPRLPRPKHPREELDQEGRLYVERLDAYFSGVRAMLREHGLVWDEFDYDDVVERRVIVARRNHCVVRNCNFGPPPARSR